MVSRDIQWAIIRRTSCFLRRQRGINKTFTREPNNLKGLNSFRYNGLIHKRVLGVEPAPDGKKGVVLVTKRAKFQRKPAKSYGRTTLTRGRRPTMSAIKNIVKNNDYKVGLLKAAQRRAAQILRSQRAVTVKKQPRRRSRKEKAAKWGVKFWSKNGDDKVGYVKWSLVFVSCFVVDYDLK